MKQSQRESGNNQCENFSKIGRFLFFQPKKMQMRKTGFFRHITLLSQ